MAEDRREHLIRFYSILDDLEKRIGGARTLADCDGQMDWPDRGVYFFRESGEARSNTGNGPRVVRVGTHGLKTNAGTTLWTRLSQHKGRKATGSGNHRGSIFRLLVGTVLIKQRELDFPTWGLGNTASRDVREAERALECKVSQTIGGMPFLWLAIEDEPGPDSLRGYIERNSIALLSNYARPPLDPPSQHWLGLRCSRERVRNSGLWNSNHVDQNYDPAYLDALARAVSAMPGTS